MTEPTVLLFHPGETVRFQPPGSRTTYLLKVPPKYEEHRIPQKAKILGGRRWGNLDLARAMRDELVRILAAAEEDDEESVATVAAWLDGAEAAYATWQGERSDENSIAFSQAMEPTPAVSAIERVVYRASESYRTMHADQQEWPHFYARAAVTDYLIGIEGPFPVPFQRGIKGVPEKVIAEIPADDLIAIGVRIAELITPPVAMEKNSASASSGFSSETSSPASSKPPESDPSPETTASTPGSSSASQPSTSTLPIS